MNRLRSHLCFIIMLALVASPWQYTYALVGVHDDDIMSDDVVENGDGNGAAADTEEDTIRVDEESDQEVVELLQIQESMEEEAARAEDITANISVTGEQPDMSSSSDSDSPSNATTTHVEVDSHNHENEVAASITSMELLLDTTASTSATSSPLVVGLSHSASSSHGTSSPTDSVATTGGVGRSSEPLALASSSPSTTIATGAAIASANLINIVNTSLVNSRGAVVVVDMYGNEIGAIDLRQGNASTSCTLAACAIDNLRLQIANDAVIDNTVVVSAQTGNNQLTNASSGAIVTGDAFANANIINLANTTLTNANYLLAIVNAFSSVSGDIVLPSLYVTGAQSTAAVMAIANEVVVTNDVVTSASTGDNQVTGGVQQSVVSGQAQASAHFYNLINSALVNGMSASVLLRVAGTWHGAAHGLPDGVSMTETPQGYLLNFSSPTDGPVVGRATTTGSSTARISNTVVTDARTGNNTIEGAKEALISTGNAFANANIVNVANVNVVGRNWLMGIINIFGDLHGDLAFGRPDLWVGGQATLPSKVRNGSEVTFTYTIVNRGDAVARDVSFTTTDTTFLTFTDNTETRTLGTLDPGEQTTVSMVATVAGASNDSDIMHAVSAASAEPDNDDVDNNEIVSFSLTRTSGGGSLRGNINDGSGFGEDRAGQTDDSDNQVSALATLQSITVERQPFVQMVAESGENIVETITLTNPTTKVIANVQFVDQMRHSNGVIVQEEVWELGDVLPNEEIKLIYSFAFNETSPRGSYTFTSIARNDAGELTLQNNGFLRYTPEVATFIQLSNDTDMIAVESAVVAGPVANNAAVAGAATSSATAPLAPLPAALIPYALADEGRVGPYPLPAALRLLGQFIVVLGLLYVAHRLCSYLRLPRS